MHTVYQATHGINRGIFHDYVISTRVYIYFQIFYVTFKIFKHENDEISTAGAISTAKIKIK